MKVVQDINTLNIDSIPIESLWNIGDEPENKMHKIHAYPAKFPAFIITKALDYAQIRRKLAEENPGTYEINYAKMLLMGVDYFEKTLKI